MPIEDIDIILVCWNCGKKTGLQEKFMKPTRNITCPYCDEVMHVLPKCFVPEDGYNEIVIANQKERT